MKFEVDLRFKELYEKLRIISLKNLAMVLFWLLALTVLLNRDHEVVFFNDFRLLASDQLLVIWAQRYLARQKSLIVLSEDLGRLHPL